VVVGENGEDEARGRRLADLGAAGIGEVALLVSVCEHLESAESPVIRSG
jgi:hypothetical protein